MDNLPNDYKMKLLEQALELMFKSQLDKKDSMSCLNKAIEKVQDEINWRKLTNKDK